jgi:hypothetical protein
MSSFARNFIKASAKVGKATIKGAGEVASVAAMFGFAILEAQAQANAEAERRAKEDRLRMETIAFDRFQRDIKTMSDSELRNLIEGRDTETSTASTETLEILRQQDETMKKLIALKAERNDWNKIRRISVIEDDIKLTEKRLEYLQGLLSR